MAVIKGPCRIVRAEDGVVLGEAICYLHRPPGETTVQGGTATNFVWHEPPPEGDQDLPVRLELDDGRVFTLRLVRRVFSGCGPEIVRFRALER
jgi:hypothetical protein